MNKKKGLALFLAVAMILAAVTGTLAYLTDTEEAVNTFTVGKVKIALRESGTIGGAKYEDEAYRVFLANYKVMPNVPVEKNVWVDNTGNQPAYLRVVITVSNDLTPTWNTALGEEWNRTEVVTPDSTIYTFERKEALEADKSTGTLLNSFMLKAAIDNTTNDGKYEIPVFVYAIQAAGFESAEDAYKALPSDFYFNEEDQLYHIRNANGLFIFANEVNGKGTDFSGKTVVLDADIDLAGRQWAPIGQTGAKQFNGTFDGKGHTISNMVIDASDKTGNYASGLFGWVETAAKIQNVNLDNAAVAGHHYVGVVAGYMSDTAAIENCHVTKANVVCTPELIGEDWDNGDKVGGIVGYINNTNTVNGCSVKDSTIAAYRDLGGIVGFAHGTVTNNSVENVTLIIDKAHNYNGYTTDAQHDANPIVGEKGAKATVSGNKSNGVDHVEEVTPGTVDELKNLIKDAQASNGSVIINLTQDFDVKGQWTSFALGSYNGVNDLTINGNGHTISGLNQPLLTGSFAGNGVITINNLTLDNANIVWEKGYAVGAFLGHSDASGGVVLNGCKVTNSNIENKGQIYSDTLGYIGGYAGGMIGYSSSQVTVTGCSVINCTINGASSTGAIIGQFAQAATVSKTNVTGTKLHSTDDGDWRVGVIVGTANVGTVTMTEITESGNTLSQVGKTAPEHSNLYGRSLGDGITLDGATI